jgi:hypothetical protein
MVRFGPIAARSLPRQRDEAMFEIERKTLRGGKTVYRAAVGILSLLFQSRISPPLRRHSLRDQASGQPGRLASLISGVMATPEMADGRIHPTEPVRTAFVDRPISNSSALTTDFPATAITAAAVSLQL